MVYVLLSVNTFSAFFLQFTVLLSKGRLLALPTNIRLGWMLKTLANTLAYYVKATIKGLITTL
jgi:hypothetical protein